MPKVSCVRPVRVLTVSIALLGAGCSDGGGFPHEPAVVWDGGTAADALGDVGPADSPVDTESASNNPLLLDLQPDHGPYTGGTTVTLRGSNLTDDMTVTFGDALVQPTEATLIDSHRLRVKSPPGVPGIVDVRVQRGNRRSTLTAAYTYDSFFAEPSSGSIAGGTRITLRGQGTGWTAATSVAIDGRPCAQSTFVGPNEIACVVPPHAQGAVPIAVTTGADTVSVNDAFTYYEAADSNAGGFGGGHISGSINVAVLEYFTSTAVPNAYVYLGSDPRVAAPRSGRTNARGQITLSAPDLTGPVTVTASAKCFSSSTFVSVDGRDATIFLVPWLDQVPGTDCGMPDLGGGGGGGDYYLSGVQGQLIWQGNRETGPNPWTNVPAAHANERRVAYVRTTVANIDGYAPDPGPGGTVLEVIPPGYGNEKGYPYSIVARPASLAVYALAGLERTDTSPPRFTPYVMGIARSVLAKPNEPVLRVDIPMDIPLDHALDVRIDRLPPAVDGAPNTIRVQNWIDLGGEGVIPRDDVAVTGHAASDPFDLVAQPAFIGGLADARTTVRGVFSPQSRYADPQSTVMVRGIDSPDQTVVLDTWVGIPVLETPSDGGALDATRRITFGVSGSAPDMFWSVIAEGASGCRTGFQFGDVVWWQHYFPGDVRAVDVPDISPITDLTDLPRGIYQLSVCGMRVQGFDFDNFTYRYLSQSTWTAFASNSLRLAR